VADSRAEASAAAAAVPSNRTYGSAASKRRHRIGGHVIAGSSDHTPEARGDGTFTVFLPEPVYPKTPLSRRTCESTLLPFTIIAAKLFFPLFQCPIQFFHQRPQLVRIFLGHDALAQFSPFGIVHHVAAASSRAS
jgi:hypothetical protein